MAPDDQPPPRFVVYAVWTILWVSPAVLVFGAIRQALRGDLGAVAWSAALLYAWFRLVFPHPGARQISRWHRHYQDARHGR